MVGFVWFCKVALVFRPSFHVLPLTRPNLSAKDAHETRGFEWFLDIYFASHSALKALIYKNLSMTLFTNISKNYFFEEKKTKKDRQKLKQTEPFYKTSFLGQRHKRKPLKTSKENPLNQMTFFP